MSGDRGSPSVMMLILIAVLAGGGGGFLTDQKSMILLDHHFEEHEELRNSNKEQLEKLAQLLAAFDRRCQDLTARMVAVETIMAQQALRHNQQP